MKLPVHSKYTVQEDNIMLYVKKVLGIVCLIVFVIWMMNMRDADNELYRYESMKDVLERTNSQFRDTKEQLENLIVNLREKCLVWDPNLPIIYGITPTYTRPVQKAELTRLSHTFKLVQNFHWIIVEDAENRSSLVNNFLKLSLLNFTHIAAPTPTSWKRKIKEPKWKKPRGVAQRNAALGWLRENRRGPNDRGVIYFADDDNSYSLKLFHEMRNISKVGVWPVGLVGGLMVEKPMLDPESGIVIGFNSHWRPERQFPIDMAGFAVNLQYFFKYPNAKFSFNVERGFQETSFLSKLTTLEELEPRADNCTKVYVWHTRTEEPQLGDEKILRKKGLRTDENIEV